MPTTVALLASSYAKQFVITQGTEMSSNLIQQVESERHHVVVDNYSVTWNELINLFKDGDVQIDPLYQRAFRWSYEQQTRYIESLLLNIPTPPIFLSEDEEGKFEVIDGLQRFSTIIKFFAAEIYPSPDNSSPKDPENDIQLPTTLSDAPILSGLKGQSRESLPETLIRTLRYARVQIILLKRESSALAKYNVFTRLNRAGATLSNQEIRNCSARLFNSDFPDVLNELAASKEVKESLKLSSKEEASMGIQECLLRLIAFSNFEPRTQKIEEFLDEVMYKASSNQIPKQDKVTEKLIKTFEILHQAYPAGEAFRFRKGEKFSGAFSTNLFDIIAVGIYTNLSKTTKLTAENLRARIIAIHEEDEIANLVGAGSNAKSKMLGRIALGKRWFK